MNQALAFQKYNSRLKNIPKDDILGVYINLNTRQLIIEKLGHAASENFRKESQGLETIPSDEVRILTVSGVMVVKINSIMGLSLAYAGE